MVGRRWPAHSHSTAPETKSDTTASIETPSPAMKMPVWPVARKSALRPRARISFSSASAVNILPIEQSVPTVSSRLPGRLLAGADRRIRGVGWRTSASWRPSRAAVVAQHRDVGQPVVQAARQIHAELERPHEQALPALGRARRRDWRCRR